MNIKQLLNYAATKLQNAGINSANLEARILLANACGSSIEYILARLNQELTKVEHDLFEGFINRRLNFEPIAYIVGSKEFYGHEFVVNNKVLIPREDTEVLVDAVLKEIKQDLYLQRSAISILELGTGSGSLAISLLLATQNSYVIATDISHDAILVAKGNALKHKVSDRIEIIYSNWFECIKDIQFDFIVSNPPYISLQETAYVAYETIRYEPHLALFSGESGLVSYYAIAKDVKNFLKPGGKVLVEIGFNQKDHVSQIFHEYGCKVAKVYKDLAGHDRVLLVM